VPSTVASVVDELTIGLIVMKQNKKAQLTQMLRATALPPRKKFKVRQHKFRRKFGTDSYSRSSKVIDLGANQKLKTAYATSY